ncbi:hypothetical protein TSUD_255810 [Trifolium subterraneum]|uniref:Uncharacterized protein n=1 Tax=Trifolium subterraneum TaxID=3900 RepID=A0A2Z6NDY7_TRISU|nr:hypothetical protein TSUD_255810 [Trifolium subterraneum]
MNLYNENLHGEIVQVLNNAVLGIQLNANENALPQENFGSCNFVRGLHALGRDWQGISLEFVRTRNRGQVRSHSLNRAYQYFISQLP